MKAIYEYKLKNGELYPQMLPFCLHGKAPRTWMGDKKWKELSLKTREKRKCICCGYSGELKEFDCHEAYRFIYDDVTNIVDVELIDLYCICKKCHNAIHIGRARVIGTEHEAIEQMQKVNETNFVIRQNDIFNIIETAKLGTIKINLTEC